MASFLEQIKNTIQQYQMLDDGETVLVGLSGGADSTALLHILLDLRKQYRLTLHAAHVNHMLRGPEADRDETFVKNMCEKLQIPCFCTRQNAAAIAREKRCSVEAAGHRIRYAFFQTIAAQIGATRIAVAHNQNDAAETLLLHLIRGCALPGLCGMPPINGNIIRPLIQTSRRQIEEYLSQNNIAYQIDSSNLTDDYPRNYIRHTILPALEHLNPSAITTLAADTARFAMDNHFLQQQTDMLCQTCLDIQKDVVMVDIIQLHSVHLALQYRILLRAIDVLSGSTRDIAQIHLDAILSLARTGAQFQKKGLFVRRTHNALVFTKKKPTEISFCYPLEQEKPCQIPELDLTVTCTRCSQIDDTAAIYLDADKLRGLPLTVRSRQNGDQFRPAGSSGEKKLKAFLIDQKIPVDMRRRIPLLIAGKKIAAVLGVRVSQEFAPGQETTTFYKITITGGNTYAACRLRKSGN